MTSVRAVLIVSDAFLALTAIAGGISLLAGVNAPPIADLEGSPFGSYTIPGLALLVLVGGVALAATIMTLRRHRLAFVASAGAGGVIMVFEVVEVMAIGSAPGVARNLQVFYFVLGFVIALLAIAQWRAVPRPSPRP
jgi:hypothetical protein